MAAIWVILGHSAVIPKKSGQWISGLKPGTLGSHIRTLDTVYLRKGKVWVKYETNLNFLYTWKEEMTEYT